MADSRISPYSLNDLKNTTDDALGNYLRGLQIKQDNSKLDIRLVSGYLGVIISAVLFVADYKLGWDATKVYTAPAVAAYMILNGIFTYQMWFVEKGLVFEGEKNGKKLSIASKTKKHDPTYYLTVTTSSGSSAPVTRTIQTPFTTWFTVDGYLVPQPLQKWLANSIDMVAEADPKNAGKDEKIAIAQISVETSANGIVEASGVEASGVEASGVEASGVESAKSQGSKRSKRKG